MEVISALGWGTSLIESFNTGNASINWADENGQHHAAIPIELPNWEIMTPIRCWKCGTVPVAELLMREKLATFLHETGIAGAAKGMAMAKPVVLSFG